MIKVSVAVVKSIGGVIGGLIGLYGLMDNIIKQSVNDGKIDIRCKKGCTSCCTSYFDISAYEMILIFENLNKFQKKLETYGVIQGVEHRFLIVEKKIQVIKIIISAYSSIKIENERIRFIWEEKIIRPSNMK